MSSPSAGNVHAEASDMQDGVKSSPQPVPEATDGHSKPRLSEGGGDPVVEDPGGSNSSTPSTAMVMSPPGVPEAGQFQPPPQAYYEAAYGQFQSPNAASQVIVPHSPHRGGQVRGQGGRKDNAHAGGKSSARFDSSKCKTLYVGNLHPYVTDELLRDAFAQIGPVEHAKVMRDKKTGISTCYGFVGFMDHKWAAVAVNSIDGRMLYGQDVKVNWAFHGNKMEDTSTHYHIFVGDLASEVDDDILFDVFSRFGTCSDARVMWDQHTGKSRGYGFVAFREKDDAERSMKQMNGEFVGGRKVRCGWANQRGQQDTTAAPLDYDSVERGADPGNTNVYVGNLSPTVTEGELRGRFEPVGPVLEVRLQRDKGFGFVIYHRHSDAVRAIVELSGQLLGGKAVKCAWGRSNAQSSPQLSPMMNVPVMPRQMGMAQPMGMPPLQLGMAMAPMGAMQGSLGAMGVVPQTVAVSVPTPMAMGMGGMGMQQVAAIPGPGGVYYSTSPQGVGLQSPPHQMLPHQQYGFPPPGVGGMHHMQQMAGQPMAQVPVIPGMQGPPVGYMG